MVLIFIIMQSSCFLFIVNVFIKSQIIPNFCKRKKWKYFCLEIIEISIKQNKYISKKGFDGYIYFTKIYFIVVNQNLYYRLKISDCD